MNPPLIAALNYEQAATYLGISAGTLRNWICSGKGPRSVKLESARRFRLVDLDNYLACRVQDNTPAPTPPRRGRPTKAVQIQRREARERERRLA